MCVSLLRGGGVGNMCPQFCRATHLELLGNRHLFGQGLGNGKVRTACISLQYTQ